MHPWNIELRSWQHARPDTISLNSCDLSDAQISAIREALGSHFVEVVGNGEYPTVVVDAEHEVFHDNIIPVLNGLGYTTDWND